MINQDIVEFVEQMPTVTDNIRENILYALSLLNNLDVRIDSLEYRGGRCFVLRLPLLEKLFGDYCIPMEFVSSIQEDISVYDTISCGPSTYSATKESVESYIDWLDKYMPRRGETLHDIIEAGNPDNLR